jgi:hypothetical protein
VTAPLLWTEFRAAATALSQPTVGSVSGSAAAPVSC